MKTIIIALITVILISTIFINGCEKQEPIPDPRYCPKAFIKVDSEYYAKLNMIEYLNNHTATECFEYCPNLYWEEGNPNVLFGGNVATCFTDKGCFEGCTIK